MSTSTTTYRDSEVWKSAMKNAEVCCGMAARFSEEDEHDLAYQIQTTAISIPGAIAEGYGRMHRESNLKQLSIARGLAMKMETYLILAVRLKSITKEDVADAWRQTQHLINALTNIIFTMKKADRLAGNYRTFTPGSANTPDEPEMDMTL